MKLCVVLWDWDRHNVVCNIHSSRTEDVGFFKREHLSNIYHYSICTMCYEEQRVNLLLQIEGVANEL